MRHTEGTFPARAMTPVSTPSSSRQELWIVRGLTLLMALVFIGLGVMAMATDTYYGRNSKRGLDIVLYDRAAWRAGGAQILLGLLPLALWFRTRRSALIWAMACGGAFLGLLVFITMGK